MSNKRKKNDVVLKEGDCIDCWYYYNTPIGGDLACHNEYSKPSDLENGGCIFFEPKWEAPIEDEWDRYQKEWN